jgi:hypothetical protein
MTKTLLTIIAVPLLAAGLVACGGSSRGATSASHPAVAVATNPSDSGTVRAKALPMSAYEPPTKVRGLMGDGDRDAPGDADGYRTPDDDEDSNLDGQPKDENEGYRDSDDLDSLRVGHPASAADRKAVEAIVKRYYAVAVTGDGASACSLMDRAFAKSVPIDYGQFGAPYLHGGKTCAEIATREFKHSRKLLASAIYITAVHLEHPDRAYALFGSRTAPAGFIAVQREGRSWKIASLVGRPQP